MIETNIPTIIPILNQNLNILIFSQDVYNGDIFKQQLDFLSHNSYKIKLIFNFEEALNYLKSNNVDIFFVEDLYNCQKVCEAFTDLPVVAVVTEQELENHQDLINKISKGYLIKGKTDLALINNTIFYAIERKRMEDVLYNVRSQLEKNIRERIDENNKLQNEILEHRKTESNLVESEERLRTVLEVVNDGISFSDEKGFFFLYNSAMERLTGYSMQEANTCADFSRLIYPNDEDWKIAISGIADLIFRGATREVESKIVTKQGTVRYVLIFSSLVDYNKRKMFLSVYRDITERKKYEEELKKASLTLEQKVKERTQELEDINLALKDEIIERIGAQKKLQDSESRYRLLAENVSDVVWLMNMNFRWLYISPSIFNLLGYSPAEAKTKKMEDLLTLSSNEQIQNLIKEDLLLSKDLMRSRVFEFECLRKDGTTVWVETKTNVIYNEQGQPFRIMGVTRDISQSKKSMSKLVESLEEKEVLLKEIHHRVKNNLQIISSLLNLQALKLQNDSSVDIFRESQSRIKSMALIHEKLYQSEDLSKIDFCEYVNNLCRELLNSYKINVGLISVIIDIKNIFLDIDTAIPCGLIINELVSNILKYAFQEGQKGQIIIQLLTDSTEEKLLVVSDNGRGFAEKIDLDKVSSLGIQLVKNLTRQLGGTCEFANNNPGIIVKIRFTNKKN